MAKERRERARARGTSAEDYIGLDQDVTGGVAAPTGNDEEPEDDSRLQRDKVCVCVC